MSNSLKLGMSVYRVASPKIVGLAPHLVQGVVSHVRTPKYARSITLVTVREGRADGVKWRTATYYALRPHEDAAKDGAIAASSARGRKLYTSPMAAWLGHLAYQEGRVKAAQEVVAQAEARVEAVLNAMPKSVLRRVTTMAGSR